MQSFLFTVTALAFLALAAAMILFEKAQPPRARPEAQGC
jgi:hypothetical protein